ncbi:hypothetical protein [Candidatus Protochlamydia phocaeensis]|uniref:hypothetical protein n=1 Tax=Candidatus Protochlamydia phocaeensis TaxID=1414722 RepID=UPI00083931EC|nr:hypothetical protein [Candidatus Protochlamydia phocaeensis]
MKWRMFLFLGFLSLAASFLNADVLVMTHAYNKPELIYWQEAALKKFLKEDYTFIVFNDASNEALSLEIQEICRSLNVSCVEVPQAIHNYTAPYLPGSRNPLGDPSAECADTIQYMLDTVGFDYPGIVVVIDSDMFPIREINLTSLLGDSEVAAHPQYRKGEHGKVTYFLPNLLVFNMERLIDKRTLNFNIGEIDGVRVDTGGFTHYYIEQHPFLKWLKTTCITIPLKDVRNPIDPAIMDFFKNFPKMFQLITEMPYDYEFYMDYAFIHFRAGSDWNKMDPAKRAEKMRLFYGALEQILDQSFPTNK